MSLTNVHFPSEQVDDLKLAIRHYGFENLNHFFRNCGYALIKHYARGAELRTPLSFQGSLPVPEPDSHAKKRSY